MNVCTHAGLPVAVIARDAACPPHVHLGTPGWDARFEFSFWNNDVRLLDVTAGADGPPLDLLEAVRQALKQPGNLRRAREAWWRCTGGVGLVNRLWDLETNELVPSHDRRAEALRVTQASFDPDAYATRLQLAGHEDWLEIVL